MAFPACPSDNQVHKEGNRSYVYDSTLGVWDKIAELDNQTPNTGGEFVSDRSHVLGNEFIRTSKNYPTQIKMYNGASGAIGGIIALGMKVLESE